MMVLRSGDGSGSGYGDGFGSGYGDGNSDGSGSGDGSGYGYGYGDGFGSGYGDGFGSGNGDGFGYVGARWRLFESFVHAASHVMPLLNCAGIVPAELNTTLPVGDIHYDHRSL